MMSDFSEFKKAEFEGWSESSTASAYAGGFATAAKQCIPEFIRIAQAGEGATALDVCCGQGIVAGGLASAGASVTGLDFSPAMLELARAGHPDIEFVEGDATSLPYDDQSFDIVTMGFGILHIPDSQAALKEAFRVLKPGGRFVYSTWHSPETSMTFRVVFGAIAAFGSKEISMPPAPDTHAYADPDYAFAALETAGFSDPRMDTVNCYWDVSDPATPFDYFREGTVRGAILLRSQPAENARAIREAIGEAVKGELGAAGPWRIPIPAAIGSAVRK